MSFLASSHRNAFDIDGCPSFLSISGAVRYLDAQPALFVSDWLAGEQEVLQFLVKRWIFVTYPFEHRRRVLFFLVPVVREDCCELPILRGIDALVVPVNGFEFFHQ